MPEAIRLKSNKSSTSDVTDALRLSPDQFNELLEQLDEAARMSPASADRNAERYIYEAEDVVLEVHHPGGSVGHFLIRPRNISDTGIGFLHGGFLYEKSTCSVVMFQKGGVPLRVVGTVMWVRHVTGRVHEVGVKFDTPIELDQVLTERKLIGERDRDENDKPKLAGRVLYVEKTPEDCKVLAMHLRRLGARLETETSAVKAVGWVKKNKYDLVLIGDAAEGASAIELAKHFRENGYKGTLLALTGKDQPPPDAKETESPFNNTIQRMYTEKQVLDRLSDYLKTA